MDIVSSSAHFENLMRYWKRRRYQRFNDRDNNYGKKKRKLKIIRLKGPKPRRAWKLRTNRMLRWKILSPIRILARIHNVYVNMMIQLAANMGTWKSNGLFRGKKVARDGHISVLSCGEKVDGRLVLEIYRRLAASRDLGEF